MKRILAVAALCAAFSFSAVAQEPAPPVKPDFLKRYLKDKPVIALAVIHGGANLADGISTKHFESVCASCNETDPVTRLFIGPRPTWARMAPWGTAEVIGFSLLAHEMHQSRHKWVRRIWWVPQTVSISLHTQAVVHIYRTF